MRHALLLLGLAGCPYWQDPTTSSTSGMAGRLLDPLGSPIVDVEVLNLEMSTRTDDEGGFGIRYKKPELYVTFRRQGVWYRRAYQAADEGQAVDIQLPEVHSLGLDCGGLTCNAELRWDFGRGLTARARGKCKPGARPTIEGAPKQVPTVSCSAKGVTVSEEGAVSGGVFSIWGPPRMVTFELDADGEASDCHLDVDGTTHALIDGSVSIELRGFPWAQPTCEGRPGMPIRLLADSAVLPWSATGPSLQPPAGIELSKLVLWSDEDWRLQAEAGPEGVFKLPPLKQGRYTLLLHAGQLGEVPTDVPKHAPSALSGTLLANGGFVVGLDLSQDLLDGVLEPRLKESP